MHSKLRRLWQATKRPFRQEPVCSTVSEVEESVRERSRPALAVRSIDESRIAVIAKTVRKLVKCGACKQQHFSVDDVRRCYGKRQAFEASIRQDPAQKSPNFNRDYSTETRTFLIGAKKRLKTLREQPRVSEDQIDAEYVELVRQRQDDAREQREKRILAPRLKLASDGPLRDCSHCGREVVNCKHFDAYWCNECRQYTTRPGVHQNCKPGGWK